MLAPAASLRTGSGWVKRGRERGRDNLRARVTWRQTYRAVLMSGCSPAGAVAKADEGREARTGCTDLDRDWGRLLPAAIGGTTRRALPARSVVAAERTAPLFGQSRLACRNCQATTSPRRNEAGTSRPELDCAVAMTEREPVTRRAECGRDDVLTERRQHGGPEDRGLDRRVRPVCGNPSGRRRLQCPAVGNRA